MSNRSHSNSYVFQLSQRRDDSRHRQYEKGHKLGEGGFAACFKAYRYSDRRTFAMKIIKLNDKRELNNSRDRHRASNHPKQSSLQKAKAEAKLLKMCNHEHIVRYETQFIHENNFYLIMEYCQKGNLAQMMKKRGTISELETRYFLRQMIQSLQYLKQRKIIHREQNFMIKSLKPANFLLTDKLKLKIADFGLATEVKNNQPNQKNICGTPNYISPEMIARSQYSYEVDLWSIGVIIYSMLYGVAPFQTQKKDARQTYEKIKKCQYNLIYKKVSHEARNLISKILVLDPKKRIKLQDIFQHPFMTNFEIPQELPVRFVTQQPDRRFLLYYGEEKKSFKSSHKEESIKYSVGSQKSQRKSQFSNSFSMTSQRQLSNKLSKKQRKREKKYIKNEYKNKRKQMVYSIKKIQKQEILTSSPYSQPESLYKSQKNKLIQFPSKDKNLQIQFAQIEKSSKKSKSDLTQKQFKETQKILQDIINESKKQTIRQTEQNQEDMNLSKPFLQFDSMLKNLSLSFQEMVDQKQEQNQALRNQSLLKYKGKELRQKYNQRSKRILNGHNKKEKNFIIEDFLLLSPSMHLQSTKTMKLIYCIREQGQIQGQKNNMQNYLNRKEQNLTVRKFIGVIFNDNSSIVTKITIKNHNIFTKSIYIKNVNTYGKFNNDQISFSKLLSSNQKFSIEQQNKSENLIELGENVFDFDKKDCKKYINKKQKIHLQYFSNLPFEVRLKLRYAQDANRYFAHLLRPNSQNTNSQKMQQTYSKQIQDNHDFTFVKFFHSKRNQQQIFFQLNNDSKHILTLINSKSHYQDIFSNNKKFNSPKEKTYNMKIFYPFRKMVFIKENKKLKWLKWEDFIFFVTETKEDTIIKKHQQDSDQQGQQKIPQKHLIKGKNKRSELIQHIKKQNFNKENNATSNICPNLISELCLSFREKMQFYYLRQKYLLEQKCLQNKNQSKGHLQLQSQFQVKMENGRFDFFVHRN